MTALTSIFAPNEFMARKHTTVKTLSRMLTTTVVAHPKEEVRIILNKLTEMFSVHNTWVYLLLEITWGFKLMRGKEA